MELKEYRMRFKPFGRANRQGDVIKLNCFAERTPGQEAEENLVPAECVMINPNRTQMEILADYECSWFTALVQPFPDMKNRFHVRKILAYEY